MPTLHPDVASPHLFVRFLLLVVCHVCLTSFSASVAFAAPPAAAPLPSITTFDSDDAHRLIGHSTRLMQADQFSAIEAQAALLRAKPYPAFRDGSPALVAFYNGLTPFFGRADEVWRNWQERYRRWETAFPDSTTRRVAEAVALIDYAWDARGSGYANTVSNSGWKQFRQRIALARALLESAPDDCPHRASVLLLVGMAESWPRQDFEASFARAQSRYPDYLPIYERKAIHLLPRWHGEPGELARWADTQAGPEGLYARIVFHITGLLSTEPIFVGEGFSWERFEASAATLLARYPDSNQLLIRYASVARQASRPDAARTALLRLPSGYQPSSGQVAEFNRLRRWSGIVDETVASLKSLRVYRNDYPGADRLAAFLGALTLSPDGGTVAIGDAGGRVTLLAAADLTVRASWQGEGPVRDLAYSSDGQALIVAQNLPRPGQPSVIDWLATTDLSPLRAPEAINTTIARIRLGADGTLFVFGGQGGKNSKLIRLNADGSRQELRAVASHHHELRAADLRPDGAQIAAYCNRGMSFINVFEDRDLLSTGTVLTGWIEDIRYRPDGRQVAAVSQGQHGAELALWDSPDQPDPGRPRIFPSRRGNYHGLAWRPDGTRIAVAGGDGTITVHDGEDGHQLASSAAHDAIAVRVAYAPDGDTLYSIGHDGTLRTWAANETVAPR